MSHSVPNAVNLLLRRLLFDVIVREESWTGIPVADCVMINIRCLNRLRKRKSLATKNDLGDYEQAVPPRILRESVGNSRDSLLIMTNLRVTPAKRRCVLRDYARLRNWFLSRRGRRESVIRELALTIANDNDEASRKSRRVSATKADCGTWLRRTNVTNYRPHLIALRLCGELIREDNQAGHERLRVYQPCKSRGLQDYSRASYKGRLHCLICSRYLYYWSLL